MTATRGRRLAVMVAVSGPLIVVGCAIQPDNAPREIPIEQRGQLDPVDPGEGESSGNGRVFLLAEGEREGELLLRSVSRAGQGNATAILEALLEGPNEGEIELGMTTALSAEVSLRSARLVASTLDVDLSADILELPGAALREAVAQIVFTASELENVRSVRLRVEGAIRSWPGGQGELKSVPLTVYDFPGFAESAQPDYPAVPSEAPA